MLRYVFRNRNEIVVELPLTYPLAPLVVKSGQRAGISESLWRKWTLQLTAFLQNQVSFAIFCWSS